MKGLKLGLFSDLGPKSGAELPGSANHFREDAISFVNWGVDYVKMSAFTADPSRLNTGAMIRFKLRVSAN